RPLRLVAELDALELQAPGQRRCGTRVGSIRELRLGREHLRDALAGRQRLRRALDGLRSPPERPEPRAEVGDEDDQVAGRDVTMERAKRAHPEDDHGTRSQRQLDALVHAGFETRGLEALLQALAVDLAGSVLR